MKSGDIEELYIATVLREILKGLEYLHSERKLHRDVKGWFYNRAIPNIPIMMWKSCHDQFYYRKESVSNVVCTVMRDGAITNA